jgi:hypothetical protein
MRRKMVKMVKPHKKNRENKDTKKGIRIKFKGKNQWDNSEQDASFRYWKTARTEQKIRKKSKNYYHGKKKDTDPNKTKTMSGGRGNNFNGLDRPRGNRNSFNLHIMNRIINVPALHKDEYITILRK